MAGVHYCSQCGCTMKVGETFICLDCSAILCSECILKIQMQYEQTQCICKSKRIVNFDQLKTELVKELIDLRTKIKAATYEPIVLYNLYIRCRDKYNFLTNEYSIHFPINSQTIVEALKEAERFILNYLRQFSESLQSLYLTLQSKKAHEINQIAEVSTRVQYVQKQVEVFYVSIFEILQPSRTEIETLEERNKKFFRIKHILENEFDGILKKLDIGSLIVDLIPKLSIKLGGLTSKRTNILVTTKEVILFGWEGVPIFGKKLRISKIFAAEDIIETKIHNRLLGGSYLEMTTLQEQFQIFGNSKSLVKLQQTLNDFRYKRFNNSGNQRILAKDLWSLEAFTKQVSRYLSLKKVSEPLIAFSSEKRRSILSRHSDRPSTDSQEILLEQLRKQAADRDLRANQILKDQILKLEREKRTNFQLLSEVQVLYDNHRLSIENFFSKRTDFLVRIEEIERELRSLRSRSEGLFS